MLATAPLRLLILEDVPEDAELEQRVLRRAGIAVEAQTVTGRADFVAALATFQPDLIIVDYNLPDLDGLTAVKLVRERDAIVPVLLVTGTLEDEAAVAVVKAGATDYVRKDRLARLPLAAEMAMAGAAAARERRDAEIARRATAEEIEDLYNHAPCGYHALNSDGVIVMINDTELRWLGYRREEVVGRMHMTQLLTPASARLFHEAFPRFLATGEIHNLEYELVRKDGTTFHALLNATTVTNPDGSFARSRTTLNDITQIKQAERRLGVSRAILQAEHDLSPDGIVMVGDSGVLSFNQRFAEMWGLPPGLLDGEPDRPPSAASLFKAMADRVEDQDGFIAGRMALIADRDQRLDDEIRLNDGRFFERHCAPVLQPDGTYIGRIWFYRDVTDRECAACALAAANLLKTTAIEAAPSAILCVDAQGRVILANTQFLRMMNIAPELVVAGADEPVLGAVASQMQDEAGFRERVAWLYAHPEETSHEDIELKDGRIIDRHSGPMFDENHVYNGRIWFFRDISERKHAEQRLRQAMLATVQALANTVDVRDPYTAGHQRNVSRLAAAIAREMGLPSDAVEGIELAAMVHDIGKIRVPAEILSKPGKLSPLEYQLVQMHAQAGYDIVKDMTFPWPIAQMILQHHERLDGSGYPQGLKGDAILRDAKIIAVADVVEAMASHRPYRPSLGLGPALAEIEQGKGRLYDAEAAAACIRVFRQNGFTF